jgi:hypothetical protein
MYFVSETDMLKAMHIALYSEVLDNGDVIAGENLTALFNFVDLLAQVVVVRLNSRTNHSR